MVYKCDSNGAATTYPITYISDYEFTGNMAKIKKKNVIVSKKSSVKYIQA